ncbi:unnamed protein product [Owenia fusiformis]|uniref:Uncharacterized protein n=1 Tax=Owenia fusiformis TaxID=6347 RepID=A0A8J1UBT7_OWEFU|nr:unnamed protein product [Owenia fusiformis]
MTTNERLPEVGQEELYNLLKTTKIQLFDVRTPEEITEQGKIAEAVTLPLLQVKGAFEGTEEKFKETYGVDRPNPEDKNFIFTCRSGRRSFYAMAVVHELGWKWAKNHEGGWLVWPYKEETSQKM